MKKIKRLIKMTLKGIGTSRSKVQKQTRQEQVLQAQFSQDRKDALNNFFRAGIGGEYIMHDFEASKLFKKQIKSRLMLFNLYQTPEGINHPDIESCFNTFIIDYYLDETLNNFAKWKKKTTTSVHKLVVP
jgi:hypothetical protein